MSEINENLERIQAMAGGDAQWDFSENDIRALKWALQEIKRLKAQNEIMKAQRTEQISENQLLKAENEKLRDDTLEEAALIADEHWPESGHAHQLGAVSCQMSISIEIRRLKGNGPEHRGKIERFKNSAKSLAAMIPYFHARSHHGGASSWDACQQEICVKAREVLGE